MEGPRNKQSGFSIVEGLLTVLVIGALAGVSLVVYQHNRVKLSGATGGTQTTTQPTITTQPTATSATYTSTAGGFSFAYPAGWKVTEQPPVPGVDPDDQISIDAPASTTSQPTTGRVTYTDRFLMTLLISSNPDVSPRGTVSAGTIQKLANGISLWTSSSDLATRPTSSGGSTACPELAIVNANGTHFSYALSNGQNLALIAGYCESQGDTSALSYQQQLVSANWQAAIGIMQSIQLK